MRCHLLSLLMACALTGAALADEDDGQTVAPATVVKPDPTRAECLELSNWSTRREFDDAERALLRICIGKFGSGLLAGAVPTSVAPSTNPFWGDIDLVEPDKYEQMQWEGYTTDPMSEAQGE